MDLPSETATDPMGPPLDPLAYGVLGERIRAGEAKEAIHSSAALATLHLGLALDAFTLEHVPGVVRVVHHHLGPPLRGTLLSFRLRLVQSCRAVAIAARANTEGLHDEDIERTTQILEVLVRDRDQAVATPAAAAMGALAKRSARASAFLTPASSSATAARKRRVLAGRVVQWALGDEDVAIEKLLHGIDSFGYAEAIRALGAWRSSAPQTIDDAVLGLTKADGPSEVHLAATEYALGIADAAPRAHLLSELRAMARPEEPGFSLWVGKRAHLAWELLERMRDLRVHGSDSSSKSRPLLTEDVTRIYEHVDHMLRWMNETESGPGVQAAEEALDYGFVASTLLTDAAMATSAGDDVASKRWKTWARMTMMLRTHRVGALRRAGRDRLLVRDAARKLSRALDATPKPSQREIAPADVTSPAAVLRDAHDRLTKNKEGLLDRSLARLFALALEVSRGGDVAPVDTLALMLPFQRKVLNHFASTFALEGLEHVLEEIVLLGDVLDDVKKATAHPHTPATRRVRRKLATTLETRLSELERAAGGLPDAPLARGLDELVNACIELLHAGEPTGQALNLSLERAIEGVTGSVHEALLRQGLAKSSSAGTSPNTKKLRQLLTSIDEATIGDDVAMSAHKKDLARLLPSALDGLLEVVIVLRGALDPESHGPTTGTIIGDYIVVKMLGRGGMGACVLAKPRSVRTAPHVVLKLPRKTTGLHRTLFRSEALALLSLADAPHPGIVRFVAFNDGAGVAPHLVMEWVEGQSLEKRIADGPLPVSEALVVFASLAKAVAHAHRHGIGHYDIKPANVMLATPKKGAPNAPCLPTLVDWGIAGGTFRTNVGTPEYMAPERYQLVEVEAAGTPIALSSDVYALACLLCEMVSGKMLLGGPIDSDDEQVKPGCGQMFRRIPAGGYREILIAHFISGDEHVRKARVDRSLSRAPAWLIALTKRMLASDPSERPTAAQVVEALESMDATTNS